VALVVVVLVVRALVLVGLAPGDSILILLAVAMLDSLVDLIRTTSSVNSSVVVAAKAQLDLVWVAWAAWAVWVVWVAVKALDR
jgi:hypothetical protein